MGHPHVEYLSHHWLILAGPAFLPAFAVVGVVLYVALKDRRNADSPDQTHLTTDPIDRAGIRAYTASGAIVSLRYFAVS